MTIYLPPVDICDGITLLTLIGKNQSIVDISSTTSEVPNRRADRNKRAGLEKSATLLAYLLSKLINEQSGIFHLLHEKLRAGWKENLKNLSEHALLLGTSE